MKSLRILIFITPILIIVSCVPIERSTNEISCAELMKGMDILYSGWSYKQLPETNIEVCLPSRNSLLRGPIDLGYEFVFRHPEWLRSGVIQLAIPEMPSSEWTLSESPKGKPRIYINLVEVSQNETASLEEWIIKEFSGKPIPGSDICVSHNKTTQDYPQPYLIKMIAPEVTFSFIKDAEIKIFESCNDVGKFYALKIQSRIYLVSFPYAHSSLGIKDEELLRRILETIHVGTS